MPGEAGVPAAGVRAQTRGTRPLCPSLAPFLIVSSCLGKSRCKSAWPGLPASPPSPLRSVPRPFPELSKCSGEHGSLHARSSGSKARRAARPSRGAAGSGRGRAEQLGSPLGCCRHPRASALSRRKKGILPRPRTDGPPSRGRPAPAGQTSASPDARTLGSPGSTGETVSGSTPVRGCGAGRRGRERETFRAGCGVCCAAGPRSPPTAGTRGHCRKPTRPAQAASRPRPPIPHAGAPHWLRSFISRGNLCLGQRRSRGNPCLGISSTCPLILLVMLLRSIRVAAEEKCVVCQPLQV
ncbi:uncharacterized protein [Ovis canadensis]|uniref:uncharacterized protein n=1 Tax=Ovis canadensis TaxID=37174 RepID=UPI003751DB1B